MLYYRRVLNDNLEASGITIVKECYGALNFITETKEEIFSHKLLPGWSVVTIKDFCAEMKSGATPSRSNPEYWSNGTIPWLKSGEVHNNVIHNIEEHITVEALSECSTKLLPYGTILMAMYGVTAGEVGYLGLPATTNQAICGMICKNKSDASWLFFTLLAFQKDISSQATGGAQSNLSKEFIERIHILRPQRNCSDLEKILYHIETNSAEINKLKTLQDLLLAKLSSR